MPEPDTRNGKSRGQPVSDAQAGFAGFLLFAGVIYFAFVFWQLPDGSTRWIVTGLLVGIALVVWFASRHWERLEKKLPVLRKWGHAASDFLVFVFVVAAVVLAAIYLAPEDKIVLLKIVTVVYFSLLPALLYLQFSSRRTLSVWKDYVANLYKLQIDDPANLPRPPTLSRCYGAWEDARKSAWEKGRLTLRPGESRRKVEERIELANQYRLKFRDLFGRIPSAAEPQSVLSIRSVHKLQVVMATVLMTLGWTFVVQPETVFGRSFTPADFHLANLPAIPRETFAFAFLGAYFYILQMLVRRYFQNDLKATAYINATMRIVIVILLVWVIDPLLSDSVSQATRSALAFVIGVFPTVGWQFLEQTLIRKPIGLVVDSLESEHKLGDLDGLNIWYESRLLEVGVEDMQNLATTDIVDLMLNTSIPIDRIIDWLDQAFLYLRVVDQYERDLLRAYGIRTATDLSDALEIGKPQPGLDRLLNLSLNVGQGGDGKPVLENGEPVDDKLPSRMLTLLATIKTERNLQHVQAWKAYPVVQPGAEVSASTERPPAAAPVPA
jgi:hypothetical protein